MSLPCLLKRGKVKLNGSMDQGLHKYLGRCMTCILIMSVVIRPLLGFTFRTMGYNNLIFRRLAWAQSQAWHWVGGVHVYFFFKMPKWQMHLHGSLYH